MTLSYHSHLGSSAYLDLLRSLKDEQISELRGSIIRQKRGERYYLYDEFRLGNDKIRRYIGQESEELLSRIDRLSELKEQKKRPTP